MPEDRLFSSSPIKIEIQPTERPGSRGGRVTCERCGEGINFKRDVVKDGKTLCIPCARGSYLPVPIPSGAQPKLVFIGGPSNSGKTTLIEKLIPEIALRGYRVGTVKHHHGPDPLVFDGEGKDSERHRKAGAAAVSLVSTHEIVSFRQFEETPPLAAIRAGFDGVDLVLVEGFNAEPGARIEVRRALGAGKDRDEKTGAPLAVVESEHSYGHPSYRPDDVGPLAELIVREVLQ
jgi:molybdopterin-guanine dinucleotide biosynthesis protein B